MLKNCNFLWRYGGLHPDYFLDSQENLGQFLNCAFRIRYGFLEQVKISTVRRILYTGTSCSFKRIAKFPNKQLVIKIPFPQCFQSCNSYHYTSFAFNIMYKYIQSHAWAQPGFFFGGGNTFSKIFSKNSQKNFRKIFKKFQKNFKKYQKN